MSWFASPHSWYPCRPRNIGWCSLALIASRRDIALPGAELERVRLRFAIYLVCVIKPCAVDSLRATDRWRSARRRASSCRAKSKPTVRWVPGPWRFTQRPVFCPCLNIAAQPKEIACVSNGFFRFAGRISCIPGCDRWYAGRCANCEGLGSATRAARKAGSSEARAGDWTDQGL
jgi:hypothetical protein